MTERKKHKPVIPQEAYNAIKAYNDIGLSTDPLGSYTGHPTPQYTPTGKVEGGKIYLRPEQPVQDADDL